MIYRMQHKMKFKRFLNCMPRPDIDLYKNFKIGVATEL